MYVLWLTPQNKIITSYITNWFFQKCVRRMQQKYWWCVLHESFPVCSWPVCVSCSHNKPVTAIMWLNSSYATVWSRSQWNTKNQRWKEDPCVARTGCCIACPVWSRPFQTAPDWAETDWVDWGRRLGWSAAGVQPQEVVAGLHGGNKASETVERHPEGPTHTSCSAKQGHTKKS